MITVSLTWRDRDLLAVAAREWYQSQRYPRTLFEYDLKFEDTPANAHRTLYAAARSLVDVLESDPDFGR